ncbi:MAG: Rieske 2Fe-2S domain-containing protein, partial [Elusimicrobia bacterium]|nr:Rieske 2Fe-2S domain-containing protein [Elusimicrobiota bacterium]
MKDLLVHRDIAKAEGLPARAFTDPAVLAAELETIFKTRWLLVPEPSGADARADSRPWSERLKQRGARAPVSLLEKPLFLQRGWRDSKLRLLPNVCTHAWYPLAPGPGRGERLVCAQHGRQFDATGKCLAQPGFTPRPGIFPRACDHLAELPLGTLDPLLFACLGRPAAPFKRLERLVSASLGRLPMGRLERRPQAGDLRELDGNWKQHAWNYMDKFHVQFIHKAPAGLADAIDLHSYRTELYEDASLQWVYGRDPESGFDPELLPERFRDPKGRRVFALWWFLFPNLTLNFYPWGLSVNVYEPIPGKPEKTLFRWYAWSWDDKKFDERESRWLSDQVDAEDVEAMAQVRRGARSGL